MRFYFDIIDDASECLDDEGMELADLDAARRYAIDGVRSLLSADVRAGSLSFDGAVRVREGDRPVLVVPFGEAVVIG